MTRPLAKKRREHHLNCPRSSFWDAGEFEAPCRCDSLRRRKPQWPKPMNDPEVVNDDSGDRVGVWIGSEVGVFFNPADVANLHAWLTRWLAAFDARQKRGKP